MPDKPKRTYTTYPATIYEYQVVGIPKIETFVVRADLGDTVTVTQKAIVLDFHTGHHVELHKRNLTWWSKKPFQQKIVDPIIGVDGVRPAGAEGESHD